MAVVWLRLGVYFFVPGIAFHVSVTGGTRNPYVVFSAQSFSCAITHTISIVIKKPRVDCARQGLRDMYRAVA